MPQLRYLPNSCTMSYKEEEQNSSYKRSKQPILSHLSSKWVITVGTVYLNFSHRCVIVSHGHNGPSIQEKLCLTLHHQGKGQITANTSMLTH